MNLDATALFSLRVFRRSWAHFITTDANYLSRICDGILYRIHIRRKYEPGLTHQTTIWRCFLNLRIWILLNCFLPIFPTDAIIERIHEAGFNIACQKNIELDRDLAEQLYKEHEGKEFFDSLLEHMTR